MRALWFIILTFTLTSGCSRKGGIIVPPGPPGITPPTNTGPTVPPPPRGDNALNTAPTQGAIGTFYFLGKGVADLNADDKAVIEKYTGRLFNNISDPKININLNRTLSGNYGGTATIYYYEDSPTSDEKIFRGGTFYSGEQNSDVVYNNYVEHNGEDYFKAFFEDREGALIIVAHEIDDVGIWGGRVYFKNFKCGRKIWEPACNPHQPNRCWNIKIGPYECRDFLEDAFNPYSHINTTIRKFPSRYTFIGTFEGIDPQSAFRN